MTRRRLAAALLLSWVAAMTAAARAQALRSLTPDETAVMEKFVRAVVPLLDQFGSENWVKTSDFFSGLQHTGVNRHPSVPLDVNENWERTYEVPEKSPRFKTVLMPIMERIQALMGDMNDRTVAMQNMQQHAKEIEDLQKQFHDLSSVTAHVQINRQGLQAEWAQVGTPSLPIGGAAVAHKVPVSGCMGNWGSCYVLAFGNWAMAQKQAGREGASLNFTFANPPGTAHIENAVVYMRGADDRVQELLKTLDWAKVNEGLTP